MEATEALERLAERRPLVHHLTNYVTVNLVANVTLCTGALPVMAQSAEEVEEMASAASALVINLGTLDPGFVEAALAAGKEANRRGAPVVLDPVGAGATALRTRSAERVLSELSVAAVCGNAGEVATLAGLSGEVRGVESLSLQNGDAREATVEAARTLGTTVAATGPTDYVSGPGGTLAVENGHPLMGRVVGTGCASTAAIGCFAAVQDTRDGLDPETAAAALAYFGRAGEAAAQDADGPGTFEPRLLDALARFAQDPGGLGEPRVRET
ncbi:hydroxyethylthiazole kinase [Rubrobacter aplysinae]|uniref:hydroxyethylthiazole kinase n=1 Tax=Rubrobacter aplysinae TaxID=909625 RepID=UPI00064B9D21|nr:hydroxyethylthiazole kinase [Rubrobacter aplysinae]